MFEDNEVEKFCCSMTTYVCSHRLLTMHVRTIISSHDLLSLIVHACRDETHPPPISHNLLL